MSEQTIAEIARVSLEDVTPAAAAFFGDDLCLIWSGEWRAYWKEGGHGYTKTASQAGVYTILAAYARTHHCGPEKQIAFERPAHLLSEGHDHDRE